MSLVAERADIFAMRGQRARDLAERHEHAAEPLLLYAAVADAQGLVYERAAADQPSRADLPSYVARAAMPGVIAATIEAGTSALRERVLVHFAAGMLDGIVAAWLRGEEQDAIDAYLARAATSPVLEALPAVAETLRDGAADDRHCPRCGGRPQLAIFSHTGDSLATGQRRLVCSRCATEWPYPRMTCASCGETGGANMPILSDGERLGHVRIDACDACRRYLLTIDLRREPGAVPFADEIAAVPLDIAAARGGYTKIERNLMGF